MKKTSNNIYYTRKLPDFFISEWNETLDDSGCVVGVNDGLHLALDQLVKLFQERTLFSKFIWLN
jgi:hypothetical protein